MPRMASALSHESNLLFEPDALAPQQFYATLSHSSPDPEKRLMAALLEDALSCLSQDPARCTRQQRRSLADAKQWIHATDEEQWIFSFTNVCETLGLDPDYLRRGLIQWIQATRMRSTPAQRLKKYRSGARHRKLRLRTPR